MTTFVLGMITMWAICGLITAIANTVNASEDVKDFAVGGFWWYPSIIIVNGIYNLYKEFKAPNLSKEDVMKRVERLKNHGYNPIHLVGDWYFVRKHPHKKILHKIHKIC